MSRVIAQLPPRQFGENLDRGPNQNGKLRQEEKKQRQKLIREQRRLQRIEDQFGQVFSQYEMDFMSDFSDQPMEYLVAGLKKLSGMVRERHYIAEFLTNRKKLDKVTKALAQIAS